MTNADTRHRLIGIVDFQQNQRLFYRSAVRFAKNPAQGTL